MEFIDLKAQRKRLGDKLTQSIQAVLEGGHYIQGAQVAQLEEKLAAYTGRKFCVSCSSGTSALLLPMMAWGIGAGDAVFVPDFTFFATAEMVALTGATPVFVDVEEHTFNLSAACLEEAVLQIKREGQLRPRAVIPVDLFGLPADYEALLPVANRYDLLVLEDAAQGFGGSLKGRKACTFGNASATSFFPAKPLGCYGDGGAVFTDDPALAELLRSLRVHGHGADKYDNIRIGLNARLDTVQAAILLCKLEIFEEELELRRRAAGMYTEHLRGRVTVPDIPSGFASSFAQYTIRLRDSEQRALVMERLKKAGIPTMVYYGKTMHEQKAFAGLQIPAVKCPNALKAASQVLSLPMHPYLTRRQIEAVSDELLQTVLA